LQLHAVAYGTLNIAIRHIWRRWAEMVHREGVNVYLAVIEWRSRGDTPSWAGLSR
jgi:hypothetical protein